MKRPYPRKALRQSSNRYPVAITVHQMHVVMVFRPVIANENHCPASFGLTLTSSEEHLGGDLMDQCSNGTTSHERYSVPRPLGEARSGHRNQTSSGELKCFPPSGSQTSVHETHLIHTH
jgi:hypothetical protein